MGQLLLETLIFTCLVAVRGAESGLEHVRAMIEPKTFDWVTAPSQATRGPRNP
jgi:hypothetical protein